MCSVFPCSSSLLLILILNLLLPLLLLFPRTRLPMLRLCHATQYFLCPTPLSWCSEPWFYGTLASSEPSEPWVYGTLGSSDSIGTLGSSDSSDSIGTLGSSENPPPSSSSSKEEGRGCFRVFVAGHMVLRLFLESYGTLVAVSAPLVMPMCDSDIPMNVPFTFCNKQPFPPPMYTDTYTYVHSLRYNHIHM